MGRRFPELLTPQEIGSSVLSGAQYYVTLELQERDVSLAFDYPRARMGTWELADEDSSPLIRRLEGEEISTLFRGRPPRVKIPTVIETQTSQSLTLYERRSQPERSFLTKRVVRRG